MSTPTVRGVDTANWTIARLAYNLLKVDTEQINVLLLATAVAAVCSDSNLLWVTTVYFAVLTLLLQKPTLLATQVEVSTKDKK